MLSSWPSVWDDDDLLSMTSGNNNLDVYETDDEVVVQANVAGVPADQISAVWERRAAHQGSKKLKGSRQAATALQ